MSSRAAAALLISLAALRAAAPAHAHPADEGRVESVFRVEGDQLVWTQTWMFGNLAGQKLWVDLIDRDKNLIASPEEQSAAAQALAGRAQLRFDGQPVTPTIISAALGDYNSFISLPAEPQITLVMRAPLARPAFHLGYARVTDASTLNVSAAKIAFTARFPAGGGVQVQNQSLANGVYEADITIKNPAFAARAPVRNLLLAVLAGALLLALVASIAVVWLLRRARAQAK